MDEGLDLTSIRSRFSALNRQVEGFPAVYLDGPGGSQTPDSVARAVADYLLGANANLGGPFVTSVASEQLVHEAHLAAADFLGATEEEVVFGANTTTINFLLAHAMARTLEPRDEIIVTELDHDAKVSPWLLVAGDRAGALVWVDGVHLAPHRRIDRAGLHADVLLTSAYKFFGPHLGVAAVRGDLARSLPADRVRPSLEVPAGHRFETGTLCHEALAGFLAAIEYLESLGAPAGDRSGRLDLAYARIEAHERDLTGRTLKRLNEIPGLRLYGIGDPARIEERTPTFCFNLDGWSPEALSVELGKRGLFTYHGNYYALGAMTALGLEESGGAVRAGYLHYTTAEESDRLCDAVASLA